MPLPARSVALALTLASLLSLAPSTAPTLRAETTAASGATEITSLPYTISRPGLYALKAPVAGGDYRVVSGQLPNGYAITVNASDVTLDLNGLTIENAAGPASGYVGVGSTASVHHVTLRNGTLAGFTRGVFLYVGAWDYSAGYGDRLEDLHVTGPGYSGIEIYGGGHLVRRCRVELDSTGAGSTFGIAVMGPEARVLDCDVSDRRPSGAATYGIFFNSGSDDLVANSRLSRVGYGLLYSGATGKYRDNLCAASVTTPYVGGTDAGDN